MACCGSIGGILTQACMNYKLKKDPGVNVDNELQTTTSVSYTATKEANEEVNQCPS